MYVSIIIPTLQKRSVLLQRCLKSLATQSRLPEEIIVAEGTSLASPSLRADELSSHLGKLTQLRIIAARPGAARQRNAAIAVARGDVLVFLDDDVICSPDYIYWLTKPFEEDTQGNILGGMGRIADQRRPRFSLTEVFKYLFCLSCAGQGRVRRSGFLTSVHWRDTPGWVDYCGGGVMALRRQILEIERFDDRFQGYSYMEDVDLTWRISRHGLLFYEPRAVLKHRPPGGQDRDQAARLHMQIHHHNYIFRKNLAHSALNRLARLWAYWGYPLLLIRQRNFAGLQGVLQAYCEILKGQEIFPEWVRPISPDD